MVSLSNHEVRGTRNIKARDDPGLLLHCVAAAASSGGTRTQVCSWHST